MLLVNARLPSILRVVQQIHLGVIQIIHGGGGEMQQSVTNTILFKKTLFLMLLEVKTFVLQQV